MVSRRSVLALGGGLGALGLAGCTGLGSTDDSLSLHVLNFDSEPHAVTVELFRATADRYSEAAVLRERYDLDSPPDDAVASERRESETLENEPYVVRVALEDAPATNTTYHYYPGCPDDDQPDSLYIEVRTERESDELYIAFQQDRCSGSSGWL